MLPRLVTSRAASCNHAGPKGTDGSAESRRARMTRRSNADVFPPATSRAMKPKAKRQNAVGRMDSSGLLRPILVVWCGIQYRKNLSLDIRPRRRIDSDQPERSIGAPKTSMLQGWNSAANSPWIINPVGGACACRWLPRRTRKQLVRRKAPRERRKAANLSE